MSLGRSLVQGPRRHPRLVILAAVVLTCLISGAAVMSGAISIDWASLVQSPSSPSSAVLMQVRLPRVLLGLAIGSSLALCGVLMQVLFRNPLADPALIGVSAGGALGAVSVIVIGAATLGGVVPILGAFALPLAAFAGSLVTTVLVLSVSRRGGVLDAMSMLLSGIAINALAGAGVGVLTYLATDAQLRNLTFWSLGSLGTATWWHIFILVPVLAVLALFATSSAQQLNALLLGEAEAHHLGVNVSRLKIKIVGVTCLASGAVVACSGIIGFVGLIAPHMARLLVGPGHRFLVPLSGLLGAALLVSADAIARTSVAPAELPIGVLTAFLGAPLFLWMLRSRTGRSFGA